MVVIMMLLLACHGRHHDNNYHFSSYSPCPQGTYRTLTCIYYAKYNVSIFLFCIIKLCELCCIIDKACIDNALIIL